MNTLKHVFSTEHIIHSNIKLKHYNSIVFFYNNMSVCKYSLNPYKPPSMAYFDFCLKRAVF